LPALLARYQCVWCWDCQRC